SSSMVTAAVHEQAPENLAQGVVEETSGRSSLPRGEANDMLGVISNGAVIDGTAAPHPVQASLLVSGALAFQTNRLAPSPLAGQVFQLVNPLVNASRTDYQFDLLEPDGLTIRPTGTNAPAEVNGLGGFQVTLWDIPARRQNDAPLAIRPATMAMDGGAPEVLEQQAVSIHNAVLDKAFAQLADEMDDFGDLGDI